MSEYKPNFEGTESAGSKLNKEQLEARKKVEDRKISDIKFLLQHKQFRRFFWGILDEAGAFRSPFNLNPKIQDYLIGQGDLGRGLLDLLTKADAGAFYQMFREYASDPLIKKGA